jgi:hypothetical protein
MHQLFHSAGHSVAATRFTGLATAAVHFKTLTVSHPFVRQAALQSNRTVSGLNRLYSGL